MQALTIRFANCAGFTGYADFAKSHAAPTAQLSSSDASEQQQQRQQQTHRQAEENELVRLAQDMYPNLTAEHFRSNPQLMLAMLNASHYSALRGSLVGQQAHSHSAAGAADTAAAAVQPVHSRGQATELAGLDTAWPAISKEHRQMSFLPMNGLPSHLQQQAVLVAQQHGAPAVCLTGMQQPGMQWLQPGPLQAAADGPSSGLQTATWGEVKSGAAATSVFL